MLIGSHRRCRMFMHPGCRYSETERSAVHCHRYIVGFLLANFLAPPRLSALLCSFAFFRFFDISKVSPANRLEQLPGGAGIVLDDVMAGLYTLVSLRLLLKMGWA
jgi:hypothetical protein